MKYFTALCSVLTLSFLTSCGFDTEGSSIDDGLTTSRPFYMGFTSVPYQDTPDNVNDTFSRINQNADIITHQFVDGIPWEEAFNNTALPADLQSDINNKAAQSTTEKTVVSLDIINPERTGMIGMYSSDGVMPSQAPWSTRDFTSPEVVTAYVNYAVQLIDQLDADYLVFGEEANLLLLNEPDQYSDFTVFAQQTYNQLKALRPDVELMISIALRSPDSIDTATVIGRISELIPFTDIVGLSVYPYRFYTHTGLSDPANLPADWLSHMRVIAQGKPLAVTQTAWIGETLNLESEANFTVTGTAEFQDAYLDRLFQDANAFDFTFITWYAIVDTDRLISDAFPETSNAISPDLFRRDTGLSDQDLTARSALSTWQRRFELEKQ